MPPAKKPLIAIVHTDIAPNPSLDELDTLRMTKMIEELLRADGWRTAVLPYKPKTLGASLRRVGPDLVFNLVETIDGRGDRVHEAVELFSRLGYGFTGANAAALKATTDKLMVKDILRRHGLATPGLLDAAAIESAQTLPHRYILKPRCEDSSCGIFMDSVTDDADTLRALLHKRIADFGGDWFAEPYIEGREVYVSLLGDESGQPNVLPMVELHFDFPPGMPRIADHAAKWDDTSFQFNNTHYLFDIDARLANKLTILARRCWAAFGLTGWARLDFRIDEKGEPYILDINANPCLSPGCILPEAAERAGLSPIEVVRTIIATAQAAPVKELA